ncbi:hypothetical protein ACN27F_25940 [Solwaraspora sp. WMMB335]|uniref:hypothetical protein n=1 Tax=Solwaraspora sp. WMMB335 TaxID=3404118 RepID=UPI003B957216
MVPAAAAHAGDGPWSQSMSSPCSSAISGKTGGGYGYARLTYDADRLTTRRYLIEYANSRADSFAQCAQSVAVSPYQISITLQFQFNGTSLSCTGGIDASFPRNAGVSYSCTGSGSTVTESMSTTCSTFSSSCRIDLGYFEVLAPAGASFANYVLSRTRVTVTNSSGNAVTWGTGWI